MNNKIRETRETSLRVVPQPTEHALEINLERAWGEEDLCHGLVVTGANSQQTGGGGDFLPAVVRDYLEELHAAGQSPGTVRLRGYQLAAFLRQCPLAADRDQVVAYLARPDLSVETLASQRAALTAFYDWLIRVGLRTTANPCTGLRPLRRSAGVPRPVPDPVVAAAMARADHATAQMMTLARFAGLRAAEVAAVRTDDADGRCLHVIGKGHKMRTVPLHPRVAALLADVDPPGWVFPADSPLGHWRPATVTHKVGQALPAPWTCHTLRHRFATALYSACHDLRIVQSALGHASLATTARYLAIDDDAAFQAVAGMDLTG